MVPTHLYNVSMEALPTPSPADNVLALCKPCADAVGLRAGHRIPDGPANDPCDACSGRVDLSYSPAARGIAERMAEQGLLPNTLTACIRFAIALTPEIDALLAPIDLGS